MPIRSNKVNFWDRFRNCNGASSFSILPDTEVTGGEAAQREAGAFNARVRENRQRRT
jgi:hypothetical protein